MTNSSTTLDYDNVNGVKLSLKVDKRQNSPNSRQFIITYKNIEKTPKFWPRLSLVIAIIFNILSFLYLRISLTAVLVTIIVLSFLVFFWVTHTVQSGLCFDYCLKLTLNMFIEFFNIKSLKIYSR